ncbi:MAG: hypothetical protein K1X63_08520 [Chitinophagales bacterium]|nr:hypothetical protein [Chitinophagales bacterium]
MPLFVFAKAKASGKPTTEAHELVRAVGLAQPFTHSKTSSGEMIVSEDSICCDLLSSWRRIQISMKRLLPLFPVFLSLLSTSCNSPVQNTHVEDIDSSKWASFEKSFIAPCAEKVKRLGYSNDQATHYCGCEFEYIKSHYSYAEASKEGFSYRRDVIDSLSKWLDNCFGDKINYSDQWGELPKGQIKRICYDAIKKHGYSEDQLNKICDCYTEKVISQVEPGHISDENPDSLRAWISNCVIENN